MQPIIDAVSDLKIVFPKLIIHFLYFKNSISSLENPPTGPINTEIDFLSKTYFSNN